MGGNFHDKKCTPVPCCKSKSKEEQVFSLVRYYRHSSAKVWSNWEGDEHRTSWLYISSQRGLIDQIGKRVWPPHRVGTSLVTLCSVYV